VDNTYSLGSIPKTNPRTRLDKELRLQLLHKELTVRPRYQSFGANCQQATLCTGWWTAQSICKWEQTW